MRRRLRPLVLGITLFATVAVGATGAVLLRRFRGTLAEADRAAVLDRG